jgi:hypothetical protein
MRSRAKAQPCRRLSTRLRSPLSMQNAPSGPNQTNTVPVMGQHRQTRPRALACFQKTDAIVIEQTPQSARSRRESDPTSLRGKELVPEGTKIRICSRTALNPRRPEPHPKVPPTGLERSNRSAAGCPTWRPRAPVSRPLSELPRRASPRGENRKWRLSAPLSRPGDPGLPEGIRLAADTRDGASRTIFKTRKTEPSQEAPP